MQYKIDGQLMHSHRPTHEAFMWILMYADDISLVCDDVDNLRNAVTLMDTLFTQWALTPAKKPKVLIVGRDAEAQASNAVITIRGDNLEVVSSFKYLGSMFAFDNTLDAEINHRLASAKVAFLRLQKAKRWSSRPLSLPTKLQFLHSIVMSVLLYDGQLGHC